MVSWNIWDVSDSMKQWHVLHILWWMQEMLVKQSAVCKIMQVKIRRRFLTAHQAIDDTEERNTVELGSIKAKANAKVKKESFQKKWYKNIF